MQTAQTPTQAIQDYISKQIADNTISKNFSESYIKNFKVSLTIESFYIMNDTKRQFLGAELSEIVRKDYIGTGGYRVRPTVRKITKYIKSAGFSCKVIQADGYKIIIGEIVNITEVNDFLDGFILDGFILDDIDWDSFYPRPMCPEFPVQGEVMPTGGGVFENFTAWAKKSLVENLKQYGITDFSMLSKKHQKGLLAYFKDEYKCYKAENKSIGMPY